MSILSDVRNFDLLVVGSGFFGATVAEQLASTRGLKVAVLERRNHIGGNAYSYLHSDTGIEVHKYGSHLFHTSNERVWNYVNRFDDFNSYKHKVMALSQGKIFTLPFNLHTLAQIYDRYVSPEEASRIFRSESTSESGTSNVDFETKAKLMVGEDIYERLVKGYTAKQWQTDPKNLPGHIISRLPVRFDFNSNYFNDTYEGLPIHGYTRLFEKMLSNPLIRVFNNIDFFDIKDSIQIPVIYTGPIDRYFNYQFGELGWRTLDFEVEVLNLPNFQGNSVINYPDIDIKYTRIHEYKHLHPERAKVDQTIIAREFSRFANKNDEPYYPINSSNDRRILKLYRELARIETSTFFGGRLGTYTYLDMHMAIASALQFINNDADEFLKVNKC